MGGGLSHTSMSPCRCTKARALCGLVSRCKIRLACAYNTGSDLTCSKSGKRITVLSRGGNGRLCFKAFLLGSLRLTTWMSWLSATLSALRTLCSTLSATNPLYWLSRVFSCSMWQSPTSSIITYGLIIGSTRPTVSTSLLAISIISACQCFLVCVDRYAVPRTLARSSKR